MWKKIQTNYTLVFNPVINFNKNLRMVNYIHLKCVIQ